MQVFRFWNKGSAPLNLTSGAGLVERFAGSNESVEDALRRANELARQSAARMQAGDIPAHYAYSDRPLREEVIETFDNGEQLSAAITRNSYGVLVLNTASALIADVDLPPTSVATRVVRWFRRLVGRENPEPSQELLAKIEELVAQDRYLGLRLYRTYAGFRVLVTSRSFRPRDEESQSLMRQLGTDRLYMKLCQVQECYRARLTPKPWRCKIAPPPNAFPRLTVEREAAFCEWLQRYENAAASYAVCTFVGQFGSRTTDPIVQPLVRLHDEMCCRDGVLLA